MGGSIVDFLSDLIRSNERESLRKRTLYFWLTKGKRISLGLDATDHRSSVNSLADEHVLGRVYEQASDPWSIPAGKQRYRQVALHLRRGAPLQETNLVFEGKITVRDGVQESARISSMTCAATWLERRTRVLSPSFRARRGLGKLRVHRPKPFRIQACRQAGVGTRRDERSSSKLRTVRGQAAARADTTRHPHSRVDR